MNRNTKQNIIGPFFYYRFRYYTAAHMPSKYGQLRIKL